MWYLQGRIIKVTNLPFGNINSVIENFLYRFPVLARMVLILINSFIIV
jgi:hypothetical protein